MEGWVWMGVGVWVSALVRGEREGGCGYVFV